MNNLTTSFLSPLIGIPQQMLNSTNYKLYLGFHNSWAENLWLVFPKKPRLEVLEQIEKLDTFIEYKSTLGKTCIIKLRILPKDLETVVTPFIEGKYSKICRQYVEKHFSKKLETSDGYKDSLNYLILTKHESLRLKWEKFLDVTIPEEAELYDKPSQENETFKLKFYLGKDLSQQGEKSTKKARDNRGISGSGKTTP